MSFKKREGFSDDFLWGASTSAFQVEGGYKEKGKGLTIADVVSFKNNDRYADTKIACDHYNRYKEDIELMSELGLKSYRFSMSWARILPKGNGSQPNKEGIHFYHQILDELEKYGIEPIVTLYHFDLPFSLIDEYQGWASRKCIEDYLNYCAICFEEFGERITYWNTINEQNLMIRKDKLMNLTDIEDDEKEKPRHQMNHHLFLANAKAIKLFRQKCPKGKIGPTFAYLPTYPASCKPDDMIAALEADNLVNYYLTDIYVYGEYPTYYLNYLSDQGWLPEFHKEDDEDLKNATPDFIGFNYYLTITAEHYSIKEERTDFNSILNLRIPGKFKYINNQYLKESEYGWPIDPVGFRRALMELYQRYRLPLMVTENGIGGHDELEDGEVNDQYRIDYLSSHIKEMKKAVIDGVELISYNVWTFMDVLSTSDGFSKRYGLVYIDREEQNLKDLARVKKDSFDFYKKVISTNGDYLG